jgi:hypothetical protein
MLAVVLLLFLSGERPEENGALPQCMFHQWTGLHCPGCGSTRCVYALLHGNPLEALRKNPLTLAVLPFLILAFGRLWWNWLRGGAFRDPLVERWCVRLAPAILVTIIVFTVLRNIPGPAAWLAPH